MNLFINFVPTYSEKQSVVVTTPDKDKQEEQQKEEENQKLLPITEVTEGTENQDPIVRKNSINTDKGLYTP